MPFTRLEKNGKVAFTNGTETLRVPGEDACKKRLVELLESVNGDAQHQDVTDFWKERAKEMGDLDELKRAWATEVWHRLDKAWDELFPQQVIAPATLTEDEFFSAFS